MKDKSSIDILKSKYDIDIWDKITYAKTKCTVLKIGINNNGMLVIFLKDIKKSKDELTYGFIIREDEISKLYLHKRFKKDNKWIMRFIKNKWNH